MSGERAHAELLGDGQGLAIGSRRRPGPPPAESVRPHTGSIRGVQMRPSAWTLVTAHVSATAGAWHRVLTLTSAPPGKTPAGGTCDGIWQQGVGAYFHTSIAILARRICSSSSALSSASESRMRTRFSVPVNLNGTRVVLADRRAGVLADVQRLVERDAEGDRCGPTRPSATVLPSTLSVTVPPLPRPPPSYLKSTRMMCLPGASFSLPAKREALHAHEVVVEHRLAVEQVEAPAVEPSALRRDHAVRAAGGNLHVGADLERLVLEVRRGAFGNAGHARRSR